MNDELNHLPVVDWELSLKLAGNNRELANDLLNLLTKTLPSELNAINQLYHEQNGSELLQTVHKLHGAVAYCGLPRLKAVLNHVEAELKKRQSNDVDSLIRLLNEQAGVTLNQINVF